jgi:hypothetical protein
MADSDAPDDRKMPEFSFPDPAVYKHAPTLYPCNPGPGAMNCELCGHSPIKTAYWLQNDVQKLILLVGSECVTRFEGKSGQRLAKEHIWAANRETVRGYKDLVARFRERWMYDAQEGYWGTYGNYSYRKVRRWHIGRPPRAAIMACEQLDSLTGNVAPDTIPGLFQREATTDGAITRWMKANADRAAEMAAILEANL